MSGADIYPDGVAVTNVGWTVWRDGDPIGWVRRGEDTDTLPAGTFLAVARYPLTISEAGQPLPTLDAAIAAVRRAA